MSAIMYKGKVYGAGGTGGSGGASAVSELTDVDLDNLSDGQILKWNATAEKWENADESGGGGGSGYSETTLFTGTNQSYSGEITLDDDLDNYDLVIFWTRWIATDTNGEVPFIANVKEFVSQFPYANGSTAMSSPHMALTSYSNMYLRVKMGSANNKLHLFDAHSIALAKVTGIKFDGSGGGGGGGSIVTITPTLSTGTKIADFEIDGETGELYAPQGGGATSEIIPIVNPTNTASRTFTLSKTPKKVSMSYNTSDNWYFHWSFIWGDSYSSWLAKPKSIGTNCTTGLSKIDYGADGKSFTITGSNAAQAANSNGGSGQMYIEY